MDNFTHSLTGWALGQAGLKNRTRKGLAALVMGANAPDIDVFFGWVAWAPLAIHRGVTHSLLAGLWVLPLGTAALLWLLDRWQVRRCAVFASELEMRFGWLLALAFLGYLTHPLLDWQTSYAIQLFSPWDLRWYHNDSLFIVDVWIWLALAIGIGLSRRRERAEHYDWDWPAKVALGAVVAYISANGVLSAWVRTQSQMAEPYANPEVIVLSPPPVLFWRREVIWRDDGAIFRGQFNLLRNWFALSGDVEIFPDGMDDPLARQILRDTPGLVSFRRWSILPMARVTPVRCAIVVHYGDARFGDRPGGGPMSWSVRVPTNAPDC